MLAILGDLSKAPWAVHWLYAGALATLETAPSPAACRLGVGELGVEALPLGEPCHDRNGGSAGVADGAHYSSRSL